MTTDNIRLAAFLAAVGYPVLGITIGPHGYGVVEFPEEARAKEADFTMNAPVPVKTLFDSYKRILRKIEACRRRGSFLNTTQKEET